MSLQRLKDVVLRLTIPYFVIFLILIFVVEESGSHFTKAPYEIPIAALFFAIILSVLVYWRKGPEHLEKIKKDSEKRQNEPWFKRRAYCRRFVAIGLLFACAIILPLGLYLQRQGVHETYDTILMMGGMVTWFMLRVVAELLALKKFPDQ